MIEGLLKFGVCMLTLNSNTEEAGKTCEKIRISVSGALSEMAVTKILGYELGFFSEGGNQTGKLQTRIDRGVESLMKLV